MRIIKFISFACVLLIGFMVTSCSAPDYSDSSVSWNDVSSEFALLENERAEVVELIQTKFMAKS